MSPQTRNLILVGMLSAVAGAGLVLLVKPDGSRNLIRYHELKERQKLNLEIQRNHAAIIDSLTREWERKADELAKAKADGLTTTAQLEALETELETGRVTKLRKV